MDPDAQTPNQEPQVPEETPVTDAPQGAPEPQMAAEAQPAPSPSQPEPAFSASTPPPGTVAPQSQEERTMGMLCHLSALAGYVIPAGNIIGPLIIWLMKKDVYPFVNDQGKESLNFQISMFIYILASVILGSITCGFGFILTAAIGIADLIFTIIGTVNANNGIAYRYPLTIRMIK